MKNILVVLVTVGMGYAYWYQLSDAPEPAAAPVARPIAEVEAPTPRPVFVAAHTLLDEPAVPVGHRPKQTSLSLGGDNFGQNH